MNLSELMTPSFWRGYSRKAIYKMENLKGFGFYTEDDAAKRGMRLAVGRSGGQRGAKAILYLLVDKEDGQIVDGKFQFFGPSMLLGAMEAALDLLIGKNYDQAKRVTADLIDISVRDKSEVEAFPKECYPFLNMALECILEAADQCLDLPLPEKYFSIPVSSLPEGSSEGYPGWKELPLKKKLAVIEEVLDKEIRPYIALDAGGVEVINLIDGKEVVITYQGSCTSCYSSVGTTLSYIQQMLRAKVSSDIIVTPNVDTENFK